MGMPFPAIYRTSIANPLQHFNLLWCERRVLVGHEAIQRYFICSGYSAYLETSHGLKPVHPSHRAPVCPTELLPALRPPRHSEPKPRQAREENTPASRLEEVLPCCVNNTEALPDLRMPQRKPTPAFPCRSTFSNNPCTEARGSPGDSSIARMGDERPKVATGWNFMSLRTGDSALAHCAVSTVIASKRPLVRWRCASRSTAPCIAAPLVVDLFKRQTPIIRSKAITPGVLATNGPNSHRGVTPYSLRNTAETVKVCCQHSANLANVTDVMRDQAVLVAALLPPRSGPAATLPFRGQRWPVSLLPSSRPSSAPATRSAGNR